MNRDTTMTKALWPSQTLARDGVLIVGASILVAIAAQVSIGQPVPISLQTLAILIVGFSLGANRGAAALMLYLGYGAAGLPVFANGMNGVAFVGPTAGFLVGFVGMAWAAGWAAERGIARGFFGTAIAALIISALLYVPGVAWPMGVAGAMGIEAGWVGLSADRIWAGFVAPFLLGDAIKAVLAALIVSGGWSLIRRRG
ncbi:biotin transporter BioY [Pontivivens ytuae]|uniref:Biotin transporter n=1 Tax=Pontivivens ytuae TaxID=2789856 RepID=A0A7S9LR29_9RHOB|nr:biotin transporter BioY [Pontivivens ytuae]QPH53746.1 biotin transporter BioY [Pontivivens ytuae]